MSSLEPSAFDPPRTEPMERRGCMTAAERKAVRIFSDVVILLTTAFVSDKVFTP
jgi:hypothetical protein